VATVTVKEPEIDVTGSEISSVNPLKARVSNGKLHVTGLTVGKTLSVYSVTGALLYQTVVVSNEEIIPLKAHGVYIIRSDDRTVKVNY